jgi:hypothetical protein
MVNLCKRTFEEFIVQADQDEVVQGTGRSPCIHDYSPNQLVPIFGLLRFALCAGVMDLGRIEVIVGRNRGWRSIFEGR